MKVVKTIRDDNHRILLTALDILSLRFPNAVLSTRLNYSKSNISSFINGKKSTPDTFLDNLFTTFNLDKISVLEKAANAKESESNNEVNSEKLSKENKQIIVDAFLLHKEEFMNITVIKDLIKYERADAENKLMKKMKGLKN